MARTAIVTGGGRGIGAAIATRLAADGLRVAVLDMGPTEDTVSAITAAGGEAIGLNADVSDEDSVTAAVAEVADRLGPPTVLINNAGILRDNLLFKMTYEEFEKVLSVHLGGAFLMAKAVQEHM
ncbi:beta-ketoacyl-ACP reductase, partial [Burkholderia multivorans]